MTACTVNQRLDRLAAAMERAPRAALACFLSLHVALWGLVPALVQPNLPLDVIEQLAWARDPQWTYFKHPPLPAWIMGAAATLAGGWDRAMFFVGPLATGLALLLIWRLARDLLDARAALLAVVVQESVIYFTFFSPEFNHNVVQLPLWALIGWTARRALAEDRAADWLAAGLAAALGMLGKYSTALLLASLLIFLVADPAARRRLRGAGPWLAIGACLVGLTPHMLALSAVDFGPLRFPLDRAGATGGWVDHLSHPLLFAGAQLLAVLPALLLLVLLWRGGTRPAPPVGAQDRRLIAVLCWGPFALAMAMSALSGLRFKDMWGTPFWDFLALHALCLWQGGVPRLTGRFVAAAGALFALGLAVFAGQWPLQVLTGRVLARAQFPGHALSQTVVAGWRRAEPGRPLSYVIGDVWLAGNVAFPLWPHAPQVMIDGDPEKSPWVDARALACAGGVLLWQGDGRALLARFPGAVRQPGIALPYQAWGRAPGVHVDWAILPPGPGCGA